LGISIDSKPNFNYQLTLSKLGFSIRNYSEFNNQHAPKNVYTSHVRSQLKYAIHIGSPVNNNKSQTLEAIQHLFLRFISFE
jgi:hypothetical protein